MRQAADKSKATYPTQSVLKDMNIQERVALQNGTRKRKAPDSENSSIERGGKKNLQRK